MGSPATVQVPKVLSLSLEDAKIELEKVGLLMGSVTEVYNDTIPKGKVTKTSPDAGAIVNSGSTIGVQVSSGTQTAQGAAVPGVSPPAAQVAGALRAATAPAVSGLAVPSPSQVGVPHLIGLTQTAAAGVLKSAGLTVGAITTSPSSLIPANGVSATDPADGTLVNQGAAIDLEISTGPKRDWSQYIPTALFTLLGLIVLGLMFDRIRCNAKFRKLLSISGAEGHGKRTYNVSDHSCHRRHSVNFGDFYHCDFRGRRRR